MTKIQQSILTTKDWEKFLTPKKIYMQYFTYYRNFLSEKVQNILKKLARKV